MALPENLTNTCQPRYRYPVDSLTVEAMEEKIGALEDALAICNNDKEVIKSKQPKPGT